MKCIFLHVVRTRRRVSEFFGSIETRGKTHEDMESITHARLDDSMTTVRAHDCDEVRTTMTEPTKYKSGPFGGCFCSFSS